MDTDGVRGTATRTNRSALTLSRGEWSCGKKRKENSTRGRARGRKKLRQGNFNRRFRICRGSFVAVVIFISRTIRFSQWKAPSRFSLIAVRPLSPRGPSLKRCFILFILSFSSLSFCQRMEKKYASLATNATDSYLQRVTLFLSFSWLISTFAVDFHRTRGSRDERSKDGTTPVDFHCHVWTSGIRFLKSSLTIYAVIQCFCRIPRKGIILVDSISFLYYSI